MLGPLLRYVDETSASIWVETGRSATVRVTAGERSWSTRTFAVHGHHYALVECDGIEPGTVTPYTLDVDEERVWPTATEGLELPPSVIATLKPGKPLRMAFGSCRTSVPHDAAGNRSHGVDALRAYALAMAEVTQPAGELPWPDLVLFLGDQVYADETSEEMQEFIASRRDPDNPPGHELKDYEEYAHLYRLAWSDPANRWLLSTLPSAMIFDDHDVRDDWNTSAAWRREMAEKPWWHDRIVAALASYWVYQHLGNLSPAERARDEIWQQIAMYDGEDELDLGSELDAFAARVDVKPDSYRWSFARDISDSRLVVVDSRAARVLDEEHRSMLDDTEMAWLDDQMRGGCDHLFVGTSLPFLLPKGLHHLEALSEAMADGAWGRRGRSIGEKLRTHGDLEHWAAFDKGFREVATMALEVARGDRGPAPMTVTFLSGDVHHSYVSQAEVGARAARNGHVERLNAGAILQAVCSPIRNPLPRAIRLGTAALSYGVAGVLGQLAARSAKVPTTPFSWQRVRGPWFDNNLATVEVTDQGLEMWWGRGLVANGQHDRPLLERVATVTVGEDGVARDPDGRSRLRRRKH
ncbi:MAG: Phosphodiesterase/alkaline phosphatase D [uncultured Nocardioidaceae bacterium]|uniref:Phosphodiesterase/alkaline phosphatase D n=1 Tax=uncultured Nocardioidaceae bacterium TaxID=253824 RepID=A0A6J4L9T3_9ACTN|nr:MAG: Phosphodiesterase/alkaline phosphatase D [uncultured Nocardioidaceae bacterium]